ncbi:hypothetical protein CC117_32385 [Parafrankia colletiae]|uniref:Transposase IS204/IS1001/IS1096/IS1165 DDE domain-containing protein n=1 Tax=Parafrankia colletiae TaxID=573497 RepID=A0A1S1RDR6_9ACTN|nr:hypothetical protein CC117_32385 [Parafrankia colletiae]
MPRLRGGLGAGPRAVSPPIGRCGDRGFSRRDRSADPAVPLPGSELSTSDVRGAGRGPDQSACPVHPARRSDDRGDRVGAGGQSRSTPRRQAGPSRGLLRDHDAVLNGLTLPHSSGQVEGTVNRIKMIKRQMYGRANFDLLRKRVLLAT